MHHSWQVLGLLLIASGASCQASAGELPQGAIAIQALTASAGGWLMFIGFVMVIYEIIFIVQRFLNIGIINENITIVLLIVSLGIDSVCNDTRNMHNIGGEQSVIKLAPGHIVKVR